jgi:deazaflavin-dependent oxidoreductase (nitroreductase family)
MEQTYRVGSAERIGNLVAKLLLRAGVGPKRMHLLTVKGRKTGKPYTTPLTMVEIDGQRWLVAPYGGVAWAKNIGASGSAKLSRGRVTEQLAVEPADAHESAPVLKAYAGMEPSAPRAFGVGPEASLEEFEAIASKHPVFRIGSIRPAAYVAPE